LNLPERFGELLQKNPSLKAFLTLMDEAKQKDGSFKLLGDGNLEGVLTGFGYQVSYISSCYKLYEHYLEKDLNLPERFGELLQKNSPFKAFMILLDEAKQKDGGFKLLGDGNLEGVLTGFGYQVRYINNCYKIYNYWKDGGADVALVYDFSGYDSEEFKRVLDKVNEIGLPRGDLSLPIGFYLHKILIALDKYPRKREISLSVLTEALATIIESKRKEPLSPDEISLIAEEMASLKAAAGEKTVEKALQLLSGGKLTETEQEELRGMISQIKNAVSAHGSPAECIGAIIEYCDNNFTKSFSAEELIRKGLRKKKDGKTDYSIHTVELELRRLRQSGVLDIIKDGRKKRYILIADIRNLSPPLVKMIPLLREIQKIPALNHYDIPDGKNERSRIVYLINAMIKSAAKSNTSSEQTALPALKDSIFRLSNIDDKPGSKTLEAVFKKLGAIVLKRKKSDKIFNFLPEESKFTLIRCSDAKGMPLAYLVTYPDRAGNICLRYALKKTHIPEDFTNSLTKLQSQCEDRIFKDGRFDFRGFQQAGIMWSGAIYQEELGRYPTKPLLVFINTIERLRPFGEVGDGNLQGVLTGFGYQVRYISSCYKLYEHYLEKDLNLPERFGELLQKNPPLKAFLTLMDEAKQKDGSFKLLGDRNLEGVLTGFGYQVSYINSCYKLYKHYLEKDLNLPERFGELLQKNSPLKAFMILLDEAKQKDGSFKLLGDGNL
ncbi:MAG: hypothetical protein Q8N76_02365, partial [Candidatus Omnitrophota bacterium]|nr:hypothetical protein [Candidatus Omnitrophota bacterium]